MSPLCNSVGSRHARPMFVLILTSRSQSLGRSDAKAARRARDDNEKRATIREMRRDREGREIEIG